MTIDGEYKYLEWLRAPKGAFIDTGIVLGSKSRVVMDIKVGGAKENWFGAGGNGRNSWWQDRSFAVANDNGVDIYFGYGDKVTGGGAVLPNGWRGRIEVNQGTFTAVEDGASELCRSKTLVPSSDFTCLNSLYLFANHQGVSNDFRFKDNNNVTCYGCRIYADADDAEPVRDFVPVVRLSDGAVGMIDRANGNAWYGNAGSPAFVAGPAATAFNVPVMVEAGTFDLTDQVANRHTFASLTLKGGATVAVDLTPDGCDTLAATMLDLADATAENPVRFSVLPHNTVGVGATPRTLIESNVAADDLAKFALESTVPMKLEVRDGALVLVDDADAIRTAVWLGGADDDIADPANWLCSNLVEQVTGKLPMSVTVVTLPDGCAFTCTNGAPFVCSQLNLPVTLGGDSDFRGVTARLNGTMDIRGHKVYFHKVNGSASITDASYPYQHLEWLRAPKGAFIDTGIVLGSKSRVVMDIKVGGDKENWFGAGGNGRYSWWQDRSFAIANDNGVDIYFGYGDKVTGGGAVLPNGWRGRIEVNRGTFTAVEDGASELCRSKTLVPSSDFTCLNSLYLFANHQGVSNDLRFKDNNNVTCYGCRIYADADDAEPVRDFVPVVRLSDGAVGMIDRANGNAWYGNAGSPAFVAGPAKAMPMTVGEVHFDIPKDETVTNSCLLLGGTIRVVKDGEGALVSGGVQTYYGGTQIDGGTFMVADAGAFGAAVTEVTVNPSAILEMNGKYGFDNNTFNLAGGTLRNAGGDVDSGKAQIKYVRLTADSTMVIENSYGLIGNGSSEVNLDLGGHALTVDVSDGKSFWFHDVTATAGKLTVTGAGTFAINATSLRASAATFNLDCAAVTAAVNCDVGGWTVGANTTVSGNGTVTIHGAYRPNGDSVSKYVLADGATFDLSGRSTVFDIKEKNIAFADGATIYVKPQPNIGGLVVPWTEPANFSDLTFVKAPNEKGWLTVDGDGITFRRGLVIFIR